MRFSPERQRQLLYTALYPLILASGRQRGQQDTLLLVDAGRHDVQLQAYELRGQALTHLLRPKVDLAEFAVPYWNTLVTEPVKLGWRQTALTEGELNPALLFL